MLAKEDHRRKKINKLSMLTTNVWIGPVDKRNEQTIKLKLTIVVVAVLRIFFGSVFTVFELEIQKK